jgi:phosphodiesterase/alkaline phosphatase D-like protein
MWTKLHNENHMDRRTLLKAGIASAAIHMLGDYRLWATPRFEVNPFQLGLASGDPWPDSVVLWTRLAPQPLDGGGMPREDVEVRWRIAADEQMTKVVREGIAIASPDWAHSVHVEVHGLQPDRWYWYQFDVGKGTSSIASPSAEQRPHRLLMRSQTGFHLRLSRARSMKADITPQLSTYAKRTCRW